MLPVLPEKCIQINTQETEKTEETLKETNQKLQFPEEGFQQDKLELNFYNEPKKPSNYEFINSMNKKNANQSQLNFGVNVSQLRNELINSLPGQNNGNFCFVTKVYSDEKQKLINIEYNNYGVGQSEEELVKELINLKSLKFKQLIIGLNKFQNLIKQLRINLQSNSVESKTSQFLEKHKKFPVVNEFFKLNEDTGVWEKIFQQCNYQFLMTQYNFFEELYQELFFSNELKIPVQTNKKEVSELELVTRKITELNKLLGNQQYSKNMQLKCKDNQSFLGTLHSELVFNKESNEIAIMRVFIISENQIPQLGKFVKEFQVSNGKQKKYKCLKVKKSDIADELFRQNMDVNNFQHLKIQKKKIQKQMKKTRIIMKTQFDTQKISYSVKQFLVEFYNKQTINELPQRCHFKFLAE